MTIGKNNVGDHLAYGAAIVERFGNLGVPSLVKASFAAFEASFAKYEAASETVDERLTERDAALEAVGTLDAELDESLETLARGITSANLGTRARPFASFSKYSVSDMQGLPYATEPGEVVKLVASLKKKNPPAVVASAAKLCAGLAVKVTSALKGSTAPQAAYTKALADRDALLPDLLKKLRTLKKFANAAFDDAPATYKTLFAPPDELVAPMKQAAKKAKKTRAAKKTAPGGGSTP